MNIGSAILLVALVTITCNVLMRKIEPKNNWYLLYSLIVFMTWLFVLLALKLS